MLSAGDRRLRVDIKVRLMAGQDQELVIAEWRRPE